MLLAECKNLDSDVSCATRVREIEEVWEKKSEQLMREGEKLRDSGRRFIDYKNLMDRFQAISDGNLAQLNGIAQRSDIALKKPRKKVDQCGGLACCVTPLDSNIN